MVQTAADSNRTDRKGVGMEIRQTTLHGVTTLVPRPISDHRGFYVRVFSWDVAADAGIDHTALVQENQSRSWRRTVRGLHTRRELTEAKLVRCAHGQVFDVVVDLRPWSLTFGRWESFVLDDEEHRQVYIPPGCAHGFQALSEVADVCYRVDAPYQPGVEAGIAWDDPELAIPWPLGDPILSERDQQAPALADVRPLLGDWFGESAQGP